MNAPLALVDVKPEAGLRGRRGIIDRAEVEARIAAAWLGAAGPEAARAEILEILKDALVKGRAEVHRRFLASNDGRTTARALAFLTDQAIRLIYDHATRNTYPLANPSKAERLSLAAVGGYGRGELAPQSDVDLLFLLPYKITPRSEQVI